MNTQKIILSEILIVAFLFYPKVAYNISPLSFGEGTGVGCHFLSIFSHANIFHLLGNLLCIWLIKCKFRLLPALAVSFVCSFLPQWSLWGSADAACGFSGVLFAVVGMAWGEVHRFKDMVRKCVIPLVICGLFPNVNIFIHLYCLLLGYAFQSVMCSPKRFFTLHSSLLTSK
jgi:membrane associated rhomboid family serine protease